MITLQQVKQYLGLTTTTPGIDALLTQLIAIVTAEIEAYLGATIAEKTITDEWLHRGTTSDSSVIPLIEVRGGVEYIKLENAPVKNVVLKNKDGIIPSSTYEVEPSTGIISMKQGKFSRYTYATYTAGYNPVPMDLQGVALEGVKTQYANSGTVQQGSGNIKSKTLDRFSVSMGNNTNLYGSAGGGGSTKLYLDANKSILDRYRNLSVWG